MEELILMFSMRRGMNFRPIQAMPSSTMKETDHRYNLNRSNKRRCEKLTVTPYMIFPESGMGVEVDLQGNKATKTNIQPYEGPDIHFKTLQ